MTHNGRLLAGCPEQWNASAVPSAVRLAVHFGVSSAIRSSVPSLVSSVVLYGSSF